MADQSSQFVRGTTVDAALRFLQRKRGTPAWDQAMAAVTPSQYA